MPTNRTRRSRLWGQDLGWERLEELLKGPDCALVGVGYGKGMHGSNHWTAADHASVRQAMRADWAKHGSGILAWWVGEAKEVVAGRPWLVGYGPGTRPWAWWAFDAPEPREPDETEPDYLDRMGLWRNGERARLTDREVVHAD